MPNAFLHQLMLPKCQRLAWLTPSLTAQFPGCYAKSWLESWDLLKGLLGPHAGARSLFQTNASLPDGLTDEMKIREAKADRQAAEGKTI